MSITIKENVSTEQRIDMIGQTIQESFVDHIINPYLIQILFDVNLFLLYADYELSIEDSLDKLVLFDKLEEKGVLQEFKIALGEDILEALWEITLEWADKHEQYHNSLSGQFESLKTLITTLSDKISGGLEEIKNLDLSQLEGLVTMSENLGKKAVLP